MKKLSKILLLSVVALGLVFTACNNDIDVPVDGHEGNTHVSVTLKLATNGSARLADGAEDFDENYIGKWGGDDVISNVTVYLVDGSSVTSRNFSVGATGTGTDYIQEEVSNQIFLRPTTAAAIKTTEGTKTVYVVVNETPAVRTWLNKSSVHEFEQAYMNLPLFLENSGTSTTVATSASRVAQVTTDEKDAIVMTNVAPATIDVQPNISEDETINGTDQNRASLTVQRAVTRVMTTVAGETFNVPNPTTDGPSTLGVLSDITWVAAQGENSLFVQQKEGSGLTGFETPNWGWVPGEPGVNFYDQTTVVDDQNYDYSGLFETDGTSSNYLGTKVPTKTDYATQTPGYVGAESLLSGKFVLPNTHEYEAAPADAANYTGGYKKGNTTYVMIRATFTPAAAAFVDEGGASYATGDDFYVGENGKFYTSAQAAYDDSGSAVMTKYENGKVIYYAWLNPDQIPAWYNSPTLRNNIYHIHITGFRNIGTNWNPLYPDDPDNPTMIPDPNNPGGPEIPSNPDPKPVPETITVPDPDNPGEEIDVPTEEPDNPIDPEDPLTTSETWMSVDVTVLDWKVHSYEVELGI